MKLMQSLIKRRFASWVAVAVVAVFAAPAHAALVSITGGTATGIPGNNDTLPAAGIGLSGGASLWQNGTLNITSPGVTLTLYDVGSESGWRNQIRLGNTSGIRLRDGDNFGTSGGVHSPFQTVGSVTQNPGVADIEFWRMSPSPTRFQVENGDSPHTMSGGGIASIAFAYLSGTNQIVSYATERILVMLDDGSSSSPDKDYDDGVWILQAAAPVPLPAAAWLLLSGLAGLGVIGGRRRR